MCGLGAAIGGMVWVRMLLIGGGDVLVGMYCRIHLSKLGIRICRLCL